MSLCKLVGSGTKHVKARLTEPSSSVFHFPLCGLGPAPQPPWQAPALGLLARGPGLSVPTLIGLRLSGMTTHLPVTLSGLISVHGNHEWLTPTPGLMAGLRLSDTWFPPRPACASSFSGIFRPVNFVDIFSMSVLLSRYASFYSFDNFTTLRILLYFEQPYWCQLHVNWITCALCISFFEKKRLFHRFFPRAIVIL